MQETRVLNQAHIRALHGVLLSLNLALVFFYGFTLGNFVEAGFSGGTGDAYRFLYWFFRAAVRINKLLHYQPSAWRVLLGGRMQEVR